MKPIHRNNIKFTLFTKLSPYPKTEIIVEALENFSVVIFNPL